MLGAGSIGSSSQRSATLNETTTHQQDSGESWESEKRREAAERALCGEGSLAEHGEEAEKGKRKKDRSVWKMICHVVTCSWVNVLLIFVPAGVAAAQIDAVHDGITFGLNCLAVIPLAGLLAHATETLAADMGDALGALMNVTFGNGVELIIFIALVKGEIRIVQASLLGSILANLLLILGLSFFLGGMRYREQLYNSTITQMSACLLSLSVISLVLPTSFHASFSDYRDADEKTLKISRGTSIVLLLVYIIFIVFQLKSHAFMYESTPRHVVEAEMAPGPAASWLQPSGRVDEEVCSCSESDTSEYSQGPAEPRRRRTLRPTWSRKTAGSGSNGWGGVLTQSSSLTAASINAAERGESEVSRAEELPQEGSRAARVGKLRRKRGRTRQSRCRRHAQGKEHHRCGRVIPGGIGDSGDHAPRLVFSSAVGAPKNNDHGENEAGPSSWSPFTRFRNPAPSGSENAQDIESGLGRGNRGLAADEAGNSNPSRMSGVTIPSHLSARTVIGGRSSIHGYARDTSEDEQPLSRMMAIVLLIIATALVATCAEFLVSSIEEVTQATTIGETFIGLIVLPIVGNGAEHITSIKVALKNKMDLAIGVAIGSSIQIALFITPLVVLLGWALDQHMSLYFPLFETLCLFMSAFIVNFLVLDGRSNYMEGALLCAVYVIIGLVAFFYPEATHENLWNEGERVPGLE